MKKIAIVIPSYNNRQWYTQNLCSLCAQEYDNFRAIYVDDCSSDQTGELVEKFIADHKLGHRIHLIRNPIRVGAMQNLYNVIHSCDDHEIVIILDGGRIMCLGTPGKYHPILHRRITFEDMNGARLIFVAFMRGCLKR
jgi:glycosyltransferase involved in cell wall biosynthesis